MAKGTSVKKAGGVSDEAVFKKTGRHWDEWFALIDSVGGIQKDHQEIVAFLNEKHGLDPWWQQMVTVAYEQARGKREKHEKPGGFQIGVSKTFPVSINELFNAWQEEGLRQKWLQDPHFKVTKSTRDKSIRAEWVDGKTRLDINFYAKGENKSQVTVNHDKLPDSDTAEEMKHYWRAALEQLNQYLSR